MKGLITVGYTFNSDLIVRRSAMTLYSRGVQLFSVAGQICCSKSFVGQNLVLLYLLLRKLKSFDRFRGDFRKKKRSSLRFDRFFSANKQVNTHTKKRSFRQILWDSPKSKYKKNSRTRFCNSQHQRGSINQPTNVETFGAGHFKTIGGPLVARGPRVGRPCCTVR